MVWTPPARPVWVDRLNAHGASIGDPARLVSLDPAELLECACASTGLDDFGDLGWREHYDVLMQSLEVESKLHLLGRVMVRHDVLMALQNRLRLTDLWSRRSDILQQDIRSPVFIVGSARTGTTLLHELFDRDPAVRTPLTWEMHHPVESLAGDELLGSTDAVVKSLYSAQPEYGTIHYCAAHLPNECIFLTNPMFLGEYWSGGHVVPSYDQHLFRASHAPAYRFHRRMLQTLNVRLPSERWVLKSPTHLSRLQTLFETYPDATIIQMHRDPLCTIPSVLSMMATTRWIRCQEVNLDGMAAQLARSTCRLYERQVEARRSGKLPDQAFIDVRYADLIADPLTTVAGVYEKLGWEFTDATREAMKARLAETGREGAGRHLYSIVDMGLDPQVERERFASYLSHFGIPDEY